jgi:hypothetical protein
MTGIASLLSLRGAQRGSNPPPDDRSSVRQAGDCFGAVRLAMTVEFAAFPARVKPLYRYQPSRRFATAVSSGHRLIGHVSRRAPTPRGCSHSRAVDWRAVTVVAFRPNLPRTQR